MKIVGLLSWYEEEADWLAACVTSLSRCNVDHLVAIDGAYFLYAGGRPKSDALQARTITEVCYGLGIGLTLVQPQKVWYGNEVEKRTALFRHGEAITTPDDWYMVIDADAVITNSIGDLHGQLERTDLDCAEMTLYEHHDVTKPGTEVLPIESQQPIRNLFRAVRGLEVVGNHYTYRTPDGRYLWGQPSEHRTLEPALELPSIRMEHRTRQRRIARSQAQHAYYRRRSQIGIEATPCDKCDQPATTVLPANFQDEGDGTLSAGHTNVCEGCAPDVKAKNRARIAYLGFDADGLQAHMHQPLAHAQ